MKKLLIVILVAMLLLLAACLETGGTQETVNIPVVTTTAEAGGAGEAAPTTEPNSDELIKQLFDEQKSDVQVSGKGVVTKLLADDNEGGRHQRFILELESGQTLLVAHNIDIAPRLDGLAVGDTVEFYGEYYYNDQGGGIHWTHRDPDGSHADGYLKWNGAIYQ